MLTHWFNPIDSAIIRRASIFCSMLHEDGKDFPLINQKSLAFIGFDCDFANSFRKIFYDFHNHFPNLQISDLGNFKKQDPDFVLPALKELLDSNITPILLGAPAHIIQKLSHRISDSTETICQVSNHIPDFHSDDRYECIGFQRHLCSLDRIADLEEVSCSSMSLAHMRAIPDTTEAIFRDCDIAHFDGNAIKLGDNPASTESNTSGMTCAEACQIMKYIGASNSLKIVNLCNYEIIDPRAQYSSRMTMAEMVWYFLEGYYQKLSDHPSQDSNHQEFVINTLDSDSELVFVKNELTGRWWYKSIDHNNNSIYIACSHNEYIHSSNGELPHRLLMYINRFS